MHSYLLPHDRWNPFPGSCKPTLAELFGESASSDAMEKPLQTKAPHHIFVGVGRDLFEHDEGLVRKVFDVMSRATHHEFQIETRRSERLLELSPQLDWPSNIWMGVTLDHQDDLVRIEDLRRSSARVRFVHLTGPCTVEEEDLVRIDFVMAEASSAHERSALEKACAAARCRLFVGASENAGEHALRAVNRADVLRVAGRGEVR